MTFVARIRSLAAAAAISVSLTATAFGQAKKDPTEALDDFTQELSRIVGHAGLLGGGGGPKHGFAPVELHRFLSREGDPEVGQGRVGPGALLLMQLRQHELRAVEPALQQSIDALLFLQSSSRYRSTVMD